MKKPLDNSLLQPLSILVVSLLPIVSTTGCRAENGEHNAPASWRGTAFVAAGATFVAARATSVTARATDVASRATSVAARATDVAPRATFVAGGATFVSGS